MGDETETEERPLPFSHRPRKKSESRRKGRVITFRATEDEGAEFDAAASEAGLTVSSHIRESQLKLIRQTQSRRRPLVDVAAILPAHRTLSGLANNFNQMTRLAHSGKWPQATLLENTVTEIQDILERIRRAMGV